MYLGCIWDVSGIYLGVSAFWLGCLMFCGSHVCMAYGTGSGAVGVRGATGCNTTCVHPSFTRRAPAVSSCTCLA